MRKPKRYDWLIHLVRFHGYTRGAEIGCYHGKTTSYLLRHCPNLKLYAVDKWEKVEPDPNGETRGCENWDPVEGKKKFDHAVRLFKRRLTILCGDSVEMADKVPDESLDFVFIDADHRYEAVKKDIRAWTPKVKEDGVICGHDFNHPRLPGVKKAVEEMFDEYKEANVDWVWYAKKEDYKG